MCFPSILVEISFLPNSNPNRFFKNIFQVHAQKTAIVNPATHESEIVSVSTICHNQVQLESYAKEDENIAHVTMIQPIHNNIFPRQIDANCRTVSNL